MTPAEQLTYLRQLCERKPNTRLGSAIERLAVSATTEALKASVRRPVCHSGASELSIIAEKLAALGRQVQEGGNHG